MVLETRDITADIHSSNPAVFQVGGLGVFRQLAYLIRYFQFQIFDYGR